MEQIISGRLGYPLKSVSAVLKLLDDGATIPFIARYRKEKTNALNEVDIEKIQSLRDDLIAFDKRKQFIFQNLEEQGINNPSLISRIENTSDSTELEDLYLPYKQKRETRASKARKLGLVPLAKIIMSQNREDINALARHYSRGNLKPEDVLQGARDIIAEWVSENTYARNTLRNIYSRHAVLVSKVVEKKKDEASKYRDYFKFEQSLQRIPSHRFLAISRAEKEGFLKVKLEIDKAKAVEKIENIFIKSKEKMAPALQQLKLAIKDGYQRLLRPSIEAEMLKLVKERSDAEAIKIFSENLRQLLMEAPLGAKNIMALDPGFRTGCKLVCISSSGDLLSNTTIFPHPPQNKFDSAKRIVLDHLSKYKIQAIAVGNGTAGRETEQFIKSVLPKNSSVDVYMVNESGASIYSASEVGREEFPNHDLTVRGAVSIGRRLMDPLAELVKIDPKSIGVGQYQHDVAQDKLKKSLSNTVEFTVNKVGVNVNTASHHLLQYVSGVGPKLAQSIVHHRSQKGVFRNRESLKDVKGFGAKAFEQAAGFLRIKNGHNPLDSSAVHPENYPVVSQIAGELNCTVSELIGKNSILDQLDLEKFHSEEVGELTLRDILQELAKPGLDPRGAAKAIEFDSKIRSIEDLSRNMMIPGKVTNLTKFGAFVDIGIKQDGLLHISQISEHRISDPSDVLKLGQELLLRVVDVDLDRGRIGLSLKNLN